MSFFLRHAKADNFEMLLEQEEKHVYFTCLHMVGNQEDAQDCAQEAFLKACRNYSSFRSDALFSTWLHRIAVNTCVDFLRKRRENYSFEQMQETGFDVSDSGETSYAALEKKQRMALLKEGIAQLPDDMRVIVVLREIENRSMEEISQILETPVGTVKSRLNRARQKLSKILDQHAELFSSASV